MSVNSSFTLPAFLAFVGFVPYVESIDSKTFSYGPFAMTKPIVFVVMAAAMSCLQANSANAQVVTSFFAPPTSPGGTSIAFMPGATLTPAVVAQPVVVARPAVVGSIPVRSGLFGLRTEHVPVFAGAPVMAPSGVVVPASGMTTVARPINSPFVAARPVITSTPVVMGTVVPGTLMPGNVHTSAMVPMVSSPVLPSATVQSGFRGTGPIMTPINSAPVIIAPAPTFPFNGGPFNTFTPGSVMTMQ